MSKKIKIIVPSILIVVIGVAAYFIFVVNKDKRPDFVVAELKKLSIKTEGNGTSNLDFLDNYDPSVLGQICTDVGYDYKQYLGKELTFFSYPSTSFYASGEEKHPLKVGIFSYNDQIVCVYYLADVEKDANPLRPGVFPINGPGIVKN
jgi:hypothetical protein